ncbi:hypothetical protein HPP92_023568 [Vanilla planifolia]|uniref:Mediator of RNA polymerase II transcription subunit 9 n=1 Tax=Vanilla planifolia TaxID=51239 RepID=A0A835PKU9_VANPL|nr:hypothetical protein HPP92_023833 [Vanilla planifolia]KAG0455780.1 hypothetical protein HPP92_023568 [Vanilla planifolia]
MIMGRMDHPLSVEIAKPNVILFNWFEGLHLHLFSNIEKLAEAVESGSRDQHSEALISELTSHFEKCQQILNSISGSVSAKAMTVEGQKHKLEETKQLLDQRKELIAKYRDSVEELVNADHN